MEDEHESQGFLDKNRIILAYLNESFAIAGLRKNLTNLVREIDFLPDAIVIDDIDFGVASRDRFEEFKEIAEEFQVEIWFSALAPDGAEVHEHGIPSSRDNLDDLFDIIIQLSSTPDGLFLRLLKGRTNEVIHDATMRLDPTTFLAMG